MRDMNDEMPDMQIQHPNDHDMLQQHADILYQMNDETERIIAAFESLDHSDLEDNLDYGEQSDDTSQVFYRYPPLPPGDDIDENTDTEDGAEDVIVVVVTAFTVVVPNTDTEDGAGGRVSFLPSRTLEA
jgi:hypothetical protein